VSLASLRSRGSALRSTRAWRASDFCRSSARVRQCPQASARCPRCSSQVARFSSVPGGGPSGRPGLAPRGSHGSGRAPLRHPALRGMALLRKLEALGKPRQRKRVMLKNRPHPLPRHVRLWRTAPEPLPPDAQHLPVELRKRRLRAFRRAELHPCGWTAASITRPTRSLSTLRGHGCPSVAYRNAGLVSGWGGRPCRAGLEPARFQREVSDMF
jgi:hypothetical protein